MKSIRYFLSFLIILATVSSCKDFEELELNENKPTAAPPSLVLNGVLNDLYERGWNPEQRQNQFYCCNYNYYGTNEYWSSAMLNYMTLKNIKKMEEEALKTGAPEVNPYSALAKFLNAYFYVRMSHRVGDIPLSDALLGLENPTPSYDAQKEVYLKVLTWLDEANQNMADLINGNNASFGGDIYFNNNLSQWRKAVNTFKLRVLISLSKKESDTELNIKARFKEVLDNPSQFPLMEGLADNLQYVYNGTSNLYPLNPGNRGFDKGRYNMADTHLGTLVSLNDPRAYVVANPAEAKITGGTSPTDFSAFVGAPSGESLDDMTYKAGNGEYSFINQKRYYTTLKGPEPAIQLGYSELCFNIAEAINRGWITGDAESYYNKGILSSFEFYGITPGAKLEITEPDADEVLATVDITQDYIDDYLNQPDVAYAGDNATGFSQIITQKYLAFFQNSGQEAYFNYRRTGIPTFDVGPGTGNGGKIPKRWIYPTSERTNNAENYNASLMSQFGEEVDDLNHELWINK